MTTERALLIVMLHFIIVEETVAYGALALAE